MRSLNDIEIEDILAGRAELPHDADHVSRQRLDEARAMQGRLTRAGQATTAPAGLADRIRRALDDDGDEGTNSDRPTRALRFPATLRRLAPALAAAAMLAVAVGIYVFSGGTAPAYAQPELAAIHETNVAHGNDFQPCRDGKTIARRMGQQCGRKVAIPQLPGACKFVGSTLAKFRDHTVASAVVESGKGTVSVIGVLDPAETLGFSHSSKRGTRTFYMCGFERCHMAAVSVDGLTLIATGEVDHEQLIALLTAFADAQAATRE